jgi:hypothetical protein
MTLYATRRPGHRDANRLVHNVTDPAYRRVPRDGAERITALLADR